MSTNVFNFGPELDAIKDDTSLIIEQISSLTSSVATLTKILADLVTALGGGDQPTIDAVTAALRGLTQQLSAAVARDTESR
jgi:hypothetical protein